MSVCIMSHTAINLIMANKICSVLTPQGCCSRDAADEVGEEVPMKQEKAARSRLKIPSRDVSGD